LTVLPAVPPFEELVAPSHWRTVDFISDLHLQTSEPATVAAWLHYLQTTPAHALFILGDLFEVWVGDDAIDDTQADGQPSFEALCTTALHAAAQRLPVYFMQGNRDFLTQDLFLQRSGMTGLADPTVLVWGAQRIVLSHGDLLCLDDVDYQRFRIEARSPSWQQRFLSQPLATRRHMARGIREASEARKHAGLPYADVDDPAAIAWLQTAQAHTLIHGHTHRPADHVLAPDLQRVVLSDWDLAALPPRAEVLRLSAAPSGALSSGLDLERLALAPMYEQS
jgi:UDP-2,3-diacylglucosamine hydrolase